MRREVPVGALLALCASALFQLGCAVRAGTYHPTAVLEVIAAGVLVGVALRAKGTIDARWLLGPIGIVVLHGALAPLRPPSLDAVSHALTWVPLATLVIAATYALPAKRPLAIARFGALIALGTWLAISIVSTSPHPDIDVFDMQTRGADDLLAGYDPYTTVSVTDTNDRSLAVPYTYPPVQLIITTLARATTGDVRFAMAVMLLLAALGARMALRDRDDLLRDGVALLVIGGPVTAFVLDQALVDVVPLGLMGAAVWAWSSEKRTFAAVLFGLTFAAKQPLVLGFPLLLLLPGFGKKQLAIALGVAAAITLPFLAWDPSGFLRGTVRYFIDLAPRSDALTVTNLIERRFGHSPGQLLGAASALLVCTLLWRRVERGLAAMLSLLTIALLCMFATGKIAFCNYYFLLSGLAAMVAAQLAGSAR
ncbi:MAG TPA: glycosyltransferase 87 family protein [Kofleriaceae bacterium]|nr:glycosyltransferase 87 family protein [Kofleriaceae bacterium]